MHGLGLVLFWASHGGIPWGDSRGGVSIGGVSTVPMYLPSRSQDGWGGRKMRGTSAVLTQAAASERVSAQGDLGVLFWIPPGSTQNWLSVGIPVLSLVKARRKAGKHASKANAIQFIHLGSSVPH